MDKDYSTYKINQLLDDDYFVMSERYPTPENIKFWNNQIKRFPQRRIGQKAFRRRDRYTLGSNKTGKSTLQ